MLKDRTVRKYYRTIVCGQIKEPIRACGYLWKDEKKNKVTVTSHPKEGSMPIETEYKPIRTGRKYTLLEVHLITDGRIRSGHIWHLLDIQCLAITNMETGKKMTG